MFAQKSLEFREECEGLGLFEARMPRFSQLFFHDFTDIETKERCGQAETGSRVSRRAAEAYLLSGVRLESSCGISDIWHNYIDSYANLFGQPERPAAPLSLALPSASNGPSNPTTLSHFPLPSPHPRPESRRLGTVHEAFGWHKDHSRPKPTKKIPKVSEGKPEAPTYATTPFSKASAHDSLHSVDTTNLEGKKEETDQVKALEEKGFEGTLGSPKAVGEEVTDTDTEDYGFEPWPTNPSFLKGLGSLLDQALPQQPTATATAADPSGGARAFSEATGVPKSQTDRVGTPNKRARQDPDSCQCFQPFPSLTFVDPVFTADGTMLLSPSKRRRGPRFERLAENRKEGVLSLAFV